MTTSERDSLECSLASHNVLEERAKILLKSWLHYYFIIPVVNVAVMSSTVYTITKINVSYSISLSLLKHEKRAAVKKCEKFGLSDDPTWTNSRVSFKTHHASATAVLQRGRSLRRRKGYQRRLERRLTTGLLGFCGNTLFFVVVVDRTR